VALVCENRLDGSAACPPITRGFSPPGYNLVLVGCRHPRAVPRAFGDSAQFVGLAQYAVVSVASAASQVDAECQPGTRAAHHRYYRHSWTRGACRSRLGGLPAHTASRAHPRPKPCGQYEQVVYPPSRPHPPVSPPPSNQPRYVRVSTS
jgi:hypothetical protein